MPVPPAIAPAVAPASAWMIELPDPPAAVVYAAQQSAFLSAESTGAEEVEAAATAAAQAQVARISAAQAALTQQLRALNVPVIFSVQRVYNGVAVLADAQQREAIAGLGGVAALHPLIPKVPHNAISVPYLGVPSLWQSAAFSGSLGGLRGEGVRVAVIDTGIDYLHRDFGGSGGSSGSGVTNDTTKIGDVPGFPGPRVVGGYDFVGDKYSGYGQIPQPDPDPMDCYGHGTHVAGTLAGSGVTGDGATFTGPYDTHVDFGALEIGPGVAPRASIYALKIFGCFGSTSVTDLALEWTVDPNGDGDFGDHMDVVNMSLGSAFGSSYDTSAVAADNAALVGVIVVASAGNSGDTQLITGAPAAADRVISVAASAHAADFLASFSSRGPRRNDALLKPDVAAPGDGIYSADNGSGWRGTTKSGTSMAAPHVAGFMALLRQAHPKWSVEELKALAMNTAAPLTLPYAMTMTLETPVHAGSGRIEPRRAISASVVAYAAGGSGRVSMSFGAPGVTSVYTATQQLAVANKGGNEVWVDIIYASVANLPGVEVQTPSAPLHVPAQATVETPITLVVDPAKLQRVRAAADTGRGWPWQGEDASWFAEESGYLVLRVSDQPTSSLAAEPAHPGLFVPLYVAPRPLAAMTAATTALDFTGALKQNIDLAGRSLSGSAPPTDVVSLASVFELRLRSPNTRPQGLDPNAKDIFDRADLKYVGVSAMSEGEDLADSTIYFGVTTWSPWSTPNEIGVNVLIDVDGDGEDDYQLFNYDADLYGEFWTGTAYRSRLLDLRTYSGSPEGPLNAVDPVQFDNGLFFSSALVLSVRAGDLGLSAEHGRFAFHLYTTSIDSQDSSVAVIDQTPMLYYDVARPALRFTLAGDAAPLVRDAPQTQIAVQFDPLAQALTPAAGVLILHHHNAAGAQASLVDISYRWPTSVYLPIIGR